MLCPKCGKATSDAAAKCAHCGAATRTVSARRAGVIACPHCAVAASGVMVGPLELDVCENCGATWFDANEVEGACDAAGSATGADFRLAVRELRVRTESLELRPYLNCPVCQRSLRRRVHPEFAGVAAFACTEHGAWLERRHLLRLIAEVEQHGSSEARRRAGRRADLEAQKHRANERARSERDQKEANEVRSPHSDWLFFW